MAWPQKTLTAKEILGMETDEFQTKLNSAASKEDLGKINSAVESQNQTLAEIRASLAKLTAPPPPDPDPNIAADQNDPTTQVLTDPSGFVNRQTAPIAAAAMQTQADLNEMRARQKYANHFAQFGDELMTKAANYNVAQRSQAGFWDFHIRTVLGDKVLEGKIDSGSYPSLVGSSSFAPNTGEIRDQNMGFSADEVAFYKDRNVPLTDAANIRDLMHRDGEFIDLAKYKGVKVANA